MKKTITFFLLLVAGTASAQWSDIKNLFTDSLHMPVCTASQTQVNPIMLRSYPDNGFFIIWEDDRNIATTNRDIYAQKYDGFGNMLWATDGVPVANGPNAQRFAFNSNQDYRNRSFAATDSANGFYIGYVDDSISTYDWQRIAVQHMRADGSQVFPGAGYIVVATASGQSNTYSMPFVIPDGNKGFYLSYRNTTPEDQIYVFDYRDDNGVLTSFGGGRLTDNAVQNSQPSVCGIRYFLDLPSITVTDYNIWSDGQAGCNVIMAMNGNGDGQGNMLGFNRVWRAKRDAVSTHYVRNEVGIPCPVVDSFKKGQVYPLYSLQFDVITNFCGTVGGQEAYSVLNMIERSNGFLILDNSSYDYYNPKGVLLPTGGNINANLIAVARRSISNNVVSDFTVEGIGLPQEIFESVPYERADNPSPGSGDNPFPPPGLDALATFRDTLLASATTFTDFSLAAGTQDIYAAALMAPPGGTDRLVRLQHLGISTTDNVTFAFNYKTPKQGTVIGSELTTGFTGSEIHYDLPFVSVASDGFTLFYIRDINRGSARVSPIFGDAKLGWGAMGTAIGSGFYNGSYYDVLNPVAMIDPLATGVIAWTDDRNIPGSTSNNIFMRHLDSVGIAGYQPPVLPLKTLSDPYGPAMAQPIVLTGTSDAYSVISAPVGDGNSTPVAAILDNHDLGTVTVSVDDNNGAIRTYNGQPYLDRNYTIKVQNSPAGAPIHVRLFFTDQDFSALQAADSLIKTPGDLVVIKQSTTSSIAPATYTPVAGEILLKPVAWGVITGGYYIEIVITDFSNFFIERSLVALPVTWLGVQAKWLDAAHAKTSWQVANELNVKSYMVQQSSDGISFKDVCTVPASGITGYFCTVPADGSAINYYRVLQVDLDGKFTYSKIVALAPASKLPLSIYPNPVKDKLYVTGLTGYSTLQLSDINGKILQQLSVTNGFRYIDLSRLEAGIYLLAAKGDKDSQTLKFIKQ